MIPIETPKGTFRVWTKRIGNHPTIKVLLLHGGPEMTVFPESSPRFTRQASLSLMKLDRTSGQLIKINVYLFEGILPEGAAFDISGNYLAVGTISQPPRCHEIEGTRCLEACSTPTAPSHSGTQSLCTAGNECGSRCCTEPENASVEKYGWMLGRKKRKNSLKKPCNQKC